MARNCSLHASASLLAIGLRWTDAVVIFCACLPFALNSGLFWPRRKFLRFPGTIILEFLPLIPAGLPRKAFQERLQNDIETATARLVAEGRASVRIKNKLSTSA